MYKLTPEMKRLLKKPWLWVTAIIISASVWVLGFYWASRTPTEYTLNVWVGAPVNLDDKLQSRITEVGKSYGMKEISIAAYDPDDSQYAAAFALQTSTNDIFILRRDEALTIAQADVFMTLDDVYADDPAAVKYNDKVVGVTFKEEYCVLVCAYSKKDKNMLYDVVKAVVNYGNSVGDGTEESV